MRSNQWNKIESVGQSSFDLYKNKHFKLSYHNGHLLMLIMPGKKSTSEDLGSRIDELIYIKLERVTKSSQSLDIDLSTVGQTVKSIYGDD